MDEVKENVCDDSKKISDRKVEIIETGLHVIQAGKFGDLLKKIEF